MPEETPCEETVLDGIARTCNDIMLLLDALGPPRTTNADVGYLHTHLSSLASLLKTAPPLRGVTDIRGPIQDCSLAVASLKESLSQMSAGWPKNREQIAAQMRSLIDVHNALSLRLRVEHIADETELKALKSGLDSLSREAMAAAGGFFHRKPLHHQARGKFVIREQLIATSNQSKNTRSTNVTICPSADFDAMPGRTPPSGERVKFICCCDNSRESHDSQLWYNEVNNRAWPFELVRSGTKRTWQMILYKKSTKSIVLVSLAEVVPTCIPEFQEWVVNQTFGRVVKDKLDKSPYAILTPDSLLLRTAECGQELFQNGLPKKIMIHTQNADVQWDKKPNYMQVWHYSRALWDDTDDGRERDRQSSKLLLPQPWARLQFNTGQPPSRTQAQGDNSLSINIFADSTVMHGSGGPLWVKLLRVQMAQVPIECDISLEFSRSKDAETFANQVDQMRLRLLQGFVQGVCEDEAEVFVQDSSTLSTASDAGDLARTRVSVVSSKRDGHKTPNMRMIVTRDGFPGSLCLDFRLNTLEVSKTGLQNSHNLVRFYCHYYDYRGIPITEETNWHRLVSQGRDSTRGPQRQSLGGPQIVRTKKRTANDWLDNIDELRDIMGLNDEDGEYDRARVCVIDTGLRRDYKQKFRAFKDFVDPTNRSVCDKSTSGHGTMCAHIIHSIYSQCGLYVARVFTDENADDEIGSARMADAIEWALSEEVRADIISISAGFREESPRLEEAVRKAGGDGKLIFASASNWGNRDGVAFPARHPNTICIYSTNTADKPSDFNPEPQKNAHNFALMGEMWQHYTALDKYETGTSMATAAAAGLAALILDFSRQSDNLNTFWAPQVRHMASMIAIFDKISKQAGEFRCIDPTYLLPHYGTAPTPVTDVVSLNDDEQRARIKWKIEDALRRKKLGIVS